MQLNPSIQTLVIVFLITGLLVPMVMTEVAADEIVGRDYNPWRNKDVVVQEYKALCARHAEASWEVIGQTIQNREIILVKIGNPNGGRFLSDGSLHGTEDSGSEGGLLFAKWLLESNDPEASRLLQQAYVLIIPVVNLDSYDRPNMRRQYVFDDGSTLSVRYGVDLNRNFVEGWGRSGSNDPNDDYSYRGAWAGSEPETQAVRYAMDKYRPHVYINWHHGDYGWASYRHNTQMAEYTDAVIDNYNAILASSPQYRALERGIRSGGGGGFAQSDGYAFGASSWLIEAAHWDQVLGTTLQEFVTQIYEPYMFPFYLAMTQAVAEPSEPPPPPPAAPLRTISTSGSIIYNPVEVSEPPPPPGGDYYGIGEEYHMSLNQWRSVMNKAAQWKFNIVRVAFAEVKGNVDYGHLDDVIDLLYEEYNCYTMLDMNHNWQWSSRDFGSDRWRSGVIEVGQRYKNHPYVHSIEPYNEPFQQNIHSSVTSVWAEYADITDDLTVIGWTKPVIVGDPELWNSGMTEHTIPQQYRRSNWIIGKHTNCGNYWVNNLNGLFNHYIPRIDRLRQNGLPVWNTELTVGVTGHTSVQMDFGERMVNECLARDMPIIFWKYTYNNPYEDVDEVLRRSNYSP